MQEVFYEESVSIHNEKSAKFRYTLFTVFGWLCIVSMLFSLLNIWGLFYTPIDPDQGIDVSAVLLGMVPWAIMVVISIVGAVLLFKKRHSFYLSYDYTFVSGELRLCKVLHGRKRKLLYRLSDDKLVKIGRVGSESYKKLKASPDMKEDILTPNEEAAEDKEFYYIQAVTNVGKRILVLECRQELLATILRYTRKNLLESEFNRK